MWLPMYSPVPMRAIPNCRVAARLNKKAEPAPARESALDGVAAAGAIAARAALDLCSASALASVAGAGQ